MRPSASNILPAIVLAGALVIGAEVWLLFRAQARATKAQSRLEEAKRERDSLEAISPAPTVETEKTIAAGLAEVRGHLAGLRQQLEAGAEGQGSEPLPSRSRDAFFALADLVEDARAQAAAARVTLRPDERFGFAAYATEGPAEELIPEVFRQQRIVRSTLEALFEARPQALLAVRCMPPASDDSAEGERDFVMAAGLSLRQPGMVEAAPLRLEFVGQTSSLRELLAHLAALRHPAIVRSVDVEALPAPADDSGATASEPVVRQRDSKFTVTVEYLFPPVVAVKPTS